MPVVMMAGASIAHADVTIEERTSVEGLGMLRMANMSGTSITTVSGDRARMESDMQMQSRMTRMLTRGVGPSADIIRLSDDKVYELDLKKKQYSETSLAARRAQMQAALEQSSKAQPPIAGVDESQCEWSAPKANVERTGQKASIAGLDAEQVKITASQSCTDKKSGAVCDFGLLLDQWMAPQFAGGEEARAFFAGYAQKMGLDAAHSKEAARRAESLFGRYQGIWTEIATKMRDVKGYPVKSSFALAVGGPQCQSSTPSASSSPAAGGGGIAGRIAGSILNRKKQAEPAAAAPVQVNGMVPLLTVTSELVSVQTRAPDPGAFEVPADFRKVSPQE
jgi:hypothetical protein